MASAGGKAGGSGKAASSGPRRWRVPTPEEVREGLAGLRLIDDRFMRACLKGRPDCLERIARAAIGDPGLRVVSARGQEDLPSPLGRGAGLDFLCETADGGLVDVEVESGPSRFPPRRARFYCSMADAWSLPAGAGFDDLPDHVLVVMCAGDAAGTGEQRSRFERRDGSGRALGDGSAIIYVDCTVQDDTELGRLCHDMMCADPDQMHDPLLAECVRAAKEGGAGMGNILDDAYEHGREEGFERGREHGREEGYERGRERRERDMVGGLLRQGLLTHEQIAEAAGIPLERVEAIAALA